MSYTIQVGDGGHVLTCRETVGSEFADTPGTVVDNPVIVSLVDVTSNPNSILRLTSEIIANGRLATQTSASSPKIGWNTSEALVNGNTYRLRGTVTIPGALDREGDLTIEGIGAASGDKPVDLPLLTGTNTIDHLFVVADPTQVYRMMIYVDQTAGIGAQFTITDFILEAL